MKQVFDSGGGDAPAGDALQGGGEPEQVEGLDELWQAAESYGVEPDGDLSGGLSGLAEQALGQAGRCCAAAPRPG